MDVLHSIDIAHWEGPFPADVRSGACEALECGNVLFFPRLSFEIQENERSILSPDVSDGKSKNVSLKPSGELNGTSCRGGKALVLRDMMERFAHSAMRFAGELVPPYAAHLERAATSYRPVEIAGRTASAIQDDTRLHVDAFPSRPMRGRRILRLFSNIDPNGRPRVWHVGEPFEDMAAKFLPQAREGSHAKARILAALGITRGIRSAYDGLMLGLHDGAKRDGSYQRTAPQIEIPFRAGSSWVCYTDQIMHAARAGQYVLEQTFHLDVDAMAVPARSPLKILERLCGRALV